MKMILTKRIILTALWGVVFFNMTAQLKTGLPEPKNGSVYVIAHRGAHNGIPENSLPAFQKAIDLGCDFVEIATRKTKDGAIVSVHNSTIDKYVEGQKGKVKSFTLAELKQMDIGAKTGDEWKGTEIPAVEDILQLCSGKTGVYIDLKEPLVTGMAELLKKYDMQSEAVWYIPAFFMHRIQSVNKMCSECYVMPDPGKAKNIKRVVRKSHAAVIATDMSKLTEEFVKTAHENGAMVFVDEDKGTPEEWAKIISWGTDGIQTDKPEKLIEFLKNRKMKSHK